MSFSDSRFAEALAAVTPPDHRTVVYGSSFVFIAALLLIGAFIARSFYSEPPAKLTDVAVTVIRDNPTSIRLNSTMVFEGYREESIYVSRALYPKGTPEYKIMLEAAGAVDTVKGQFRTASTIFLPAGISGSWCVASTMSWWPSLAQRQFAQALPEVCFEATDND